MRKSKSSAQRRLAEAVRRAEDMSAIRADMRRAGIL